MRSDWEVEIEVETVWYKHALRKLQATIVSRLPCPRLCWSHRWPMRTIACRARTGSGGFRDSLGRCTYARLASATTVRNACAAPCGRHVMTSWSVLGSVGAAVRLTGACCDTTYGKSRNARDPPRSYLGYTVELDSHLGCSGDPKLVY